MQSYITIKKCKYFHQTSETMARILKGTLLPYVLQKYIIKTIKHKKIQKNGGHNRPYHGCIFHLKYTSQYP